MKKRNLFNRFGFTGQLGKLGNLLEDMQSDIAGKVDKVEGKGLSTRDFSDDCYTALMDLIANERVIVTFDSDGGSSVASQTIEYGDTATSPPPPTKSGYSFNGWFFLSETSDEYIRFQFNHHLTRHITLKAFWEEVTEDEGAGGEG